MIKKLAIVLFCLFFLVELFTLSHYGKNWDETRRNYRGQAYLHYFLTGESNYANFKGERRSIYQIDKEEYSFSSFANENIIGHPPVSDILAAFANYMFFQKLGLVDDLEGYHLFIIFASALLAAVVFFFTATYYGIFAGMIAFLSLVLYPLFFAESHFNFKDPVQTAFLSLCLLTLFWGLTRSDWKWILTSSFFAGLAMGTKFNVFFAVFIVIPWIIVTYWKSITRRKWPFTKSVTIILVMFPVIPLVVLYASWPYLWHDPIGNFRSIFEYYAFWGYNQQFQPEKYYTIFGLNTYPIQWILFSTPLVILFFFAIGVIYAIKKGFEEKQKTALFMLLWFTIPIARVSMPSAGLVNGVREITEYLPAMAMLAGIGAYYIVSMLKGFKKTLVVQIVLLCAFIPITLKLFSIHPNENVYFNPLIGGLKGAKENNFWFWGNSFGNSYRQAANWINENAESNAKVSLAVGFEGSILRAWLRDDIDFSNKYKKNFLEKRGEYIVEMTSDWPIWPPFCYFVYAKNVLIPVYEVKVDDVAILTIWKNDGEHTNETFRSRENVSDLLRNCVVQEEEN